MTDIIRLGSRGSDLALWQTNYVKTLLEAIWPQRQFAIEVFSTRGDQLVDIPLPQIGGKGVFTAELETALRAGQIDLAVHSLKDLPTEDSSGLTIGAVTRRANAADVLVSRAAYTLETLPKGAAVGTSSTRRAAQLRHYRPDLTLVDLRGNVPTRVRKALDPEGPYDAIVLAHAGLERLALLEVISQVLPLDRMLPAPGQGALAIQCRDDAGSQALLQALNHAETWLATRAERAFLAHLGGGCALPIAAYATADRGRIYLRGRVLSADGAQQIDVAGSGDDPQQLGADLARQALSHGAAELLELP